MKINTIQPNIAFTLVEIMIVVAIIGLLAAIAVPNFVKARATSQQKACLNNLIKLDGAVDQWAIETHKKLGDPIVEDEVYSYLKAGKPECPGGGTYTFKGGVSSFPAECSITNGDAPHHTGITDTNR